MLKPPRSKRFFAELERQGKNNVQVWRSWSNGDEVVSQWGVKDGRMQETIDIPGPKGRKGTKAFITPEQSALDQLVRDIKKKAQRGYEITISPKRGPLTDMLRKELGGVTKATEIDFRGALPPNVSFSKPVNSVTPQKLMKLAARKREDHNVGGPPLVYTIKRNGMCHIVTKDINGQVWIQSRGKLVIENYKYPHLLREFDVLLPKKSVALCEFYVNDGKDKQDFKAMQKISNSLVNRALERQRQIGLVHAYVFRIPFWRGENLEASHPCTRWLRLLDELFDGWYAHSPPPGQDNGEDQVGTSALDYVHVLEMDAISYEEAVAEMERCDYEGWVVYDCWNSLGEKHISFLGQPDRPDVCWKVKKALEDDFIAIWDPKGDGEHCTSKCRVPYPEALASQRRSGKCCVCGKKLKANGTWGTGKNKDRVGTLSLYQLGKDGVKRYVCEVSSGLTDDQKQGIADDGLCVETAVIGYQDRSYITRGADSNALTHPKVLGFREDKELKDCINEEI